MAHAALRLQGFDQLLEGQVLMRLRAERRLAGLREQPRQPHAAVHGAAQHLRIDEEADDALGLGPVAVGHRHTYADVFLPGVAVQQRLEARKQQHERRSASRLHLAAQPLGERRRQLDDMTGRAVAALGFSWVVGRQLQHRLLHAQLRAPVSELPLPFARIQPLALPCGVVGVLHRQGRQFHRLALRDGAVLRHELVDQDLHRPAIGDDMVHHDHKDMGEFALTNHAHAQQRAAQQVERLLVRCAGGFLDQLRTQRLGGVAQVDDRNLQCKAGLHHLLGQTVLAGAKHRAQRFMAR